VDEKRKARQRAKQVGLANGSEAAPANGKIPGSTEKAKPKKK
jgi:hypothetical protein